MSNLVPIFVVGFIVLGIYRLFELFVRRKERMVILEKLGEQVKLSDVNLNLPLFQNPKIMSSNNWTLKVSFLLIGVGVGLLVGYCFEFATAGTGADFVTYCSNWLYQSKIEIVYFASVAIFGGIGLLAAYFIEKKHKQKAG